MYRFQKRKFCASWNVQGRSIMSHIHHLRTLFTQIFLILHQCSFKSATWLSKLFFLMTTFTVYCQNSRTIGVAPLSLVAGQALSRTGLLVVIQWRVHFANLSEIILILFVFQTLQGPIFSLVAGVGVGENVLLFIFPSSSVTTCSNSPCSTPLGTPPPTYSRFHFTAAFGGGGGGTTHSW